MSRGQVFLPYLKKRRKTFTLFVAFFLVFFVVFLLYRLPTEPLWYALVLCLSIGGIVSVADFYAFTWKHKNLAALIKSITHGELELPMSKDLIEQDYQQLLRLLSEEKRELTSSAEQKRRELVEYYTLWAHQIKTPIAAMRLALQSKNDEDSVELLMELFKIEQYADMVLQYLRVESPSTDFVLKRYSLDDIVRQAVHRYAKLFIRKKIGLDFKELDCEVLTDEKWLVFVIGQIFSNALKYTKEGTISVYMEDRAKKTLVIEDTGIGIAPEDLPRVFEQGFTGYAGRMEKSSTGIGLYLCKRILDKLSHTITLESEVGRGTRVKIGLDMVETFDPYRNLTEM